MISAKAHAECVRLLELLTNKRVQESWSWVFMTPVSDIPGYHEVIKKPMDLGTVKKYLGAKPSRCRFKSHAKFAKTVRLVFQNALLYNKDDEHVKGSVYDAAQHLLRVFDTAYAKAKADGLDDADGDAAQASDHKNKDKDKERRHGHDRDRERDAALSATSGSDSGRHSHHSHHSHRSHESNRDGSESSRKHKKDRKDKEKKSKKSEHGRKHGSDDKSSKSHKRPIEGISVDTGSEGPNDGHHTSAKRAKTSTPSSVAAPVPSPSHVSSKKSSGRMSEEMITACSAVLMKLIKHKDGNVSPAAPFLHPVDVTHFPDYRVKVTQPMHLYGVQKKLRGYEDMDRFAEDVRLIFSNCLIYNSDVVLSRVMRHHAVTLMKLFEGHFAKIGGTWPGIPERWKCHGILHEILAHRTDGQETAQWFKYPFQTYFDSPASVPVEYFRTIKRPMDLGTVSANLHLGRYKEISKFLLDIKLIFDNCVTYWSKDPSGHAYCASAKALLSLLVTQTETVFGSTLCDNVFGSAKSSLVTSNLAAKTSQGSKSSVASKSSLVTKISLVSSAQKSVVIAPAKSPGGAGEEKARKRSSKRDKLFPEKEVCLEILKLLKQHKMKGYGDIEVLTAGPFLVAVDVTKYPDYLKVIQEPMDFAKVERKLKGDRYVNVNDFCADVHLIFSNCHKYNSDPVEGADIRAMASNLRDYFIELYAAKFESADSQKPESELALKRGHLTPVVPVHTKIDASAKRKKSPVAASGKDAGDSRSAQRKPTDVVSLPTPQLTLGRSEPLLDHHATSTKAEGEVKPSSAESKEMKKKRKEEKRRRKEERRLKKERKQKKRELAKAIGSASALPSPSSESTIRQVVPAAPPVAPTVHISSKTVPAEATGTGASASASRSSKGKKSKKTDLSGWESACERVLNRLAKIEQVAKLHFDKPLLEVFPQLDSDYLQVIPEPMDLRTLRELLHTHQLTASEFIRKGQLIFQNAITFNSSDDLPSLHVREMSTHLRWYFESLCGEMKLADSAEDKEKRARMRRERAALVNNISMDVKAKECHKLLRVLNSQKYDKNCWPFRKPVQVLFPSLPADYYEIVKKPMDLATIGEKLNALEYKIHGDFIQDVRLTFENALTYNRADKDREGWSVYSAAVYMLNVAEEQWCDVTLEVTEKARRRELLRKERDRLSEQRKAARSVRTTEPPIPKAPAPVAVEAVQAPKTVAQKDDTESSDKTAVIIAAPVSASAGSNETESSTKLKFQVVSRSSLERMNKSERKAEEKRRKRARREEEQAKTEKRRRTAVAATDDALREAEMRSRRRIQKLELIEAARLREERERATKQAEVEKALAARMKFNAHAWTGTLVPSTSSTPGFWRKKRVKLEVAAPFRAVVDSC